MEPLDYCSNFLIGGYNPDGSTRLYSLVEEDELLASIRGRIMKKIALINPPFRGVIHRIKDAYPLGLGYIKAYCESKGVVCDLYDFSCSLLSDQALEEKYCLSDYDVIGVSSYSLFFSDTVVLIELLKKDRNIIVVGGHHATLCGSKILRDFPVIDFCLKGFGEKSFYDFISNIDTENVYSVSGLCYRKGDEFIDNPVNYEGIDINEFPVPDRGDIIVDASNYEFDATKRVFHISTSRGCPYHCTYCVNCKNNYWLARSELNVLEELNREFRGKGYKYINFVDCNFYVNPSRAESLIARIRKEYPGVKFSFQTRSDQVANNKGQLEKLLSAGDCSITLGIESNSAQVLKRYRKETTPDINQNAIDFLKQTQSQTLVYMIMFEALESLDDIRASFDFLKNNALPCTQKEIEARHNVTIEKIESDFSKIYCNCKLLLLPSQEAEGLGRGSVEASLNSVPILASNNGGIPEAVKINDFLIFDYSNYASWRNALEKLFDPTIFAIHCQKALENAIAYERRYLNNSFSEYIDSILGQKKRYKSLNN